MATEQVRARQTQGAQRQYLLYSKERRWENKSTCCLQTRPAAYPLLIKGGPTFKGTLSRNQFHAFLQCQYTFNFSSRDCGSIASSGGQSHMREGLLEWTHPGHTASYANSLCQYEGIMCLWPPLLSPQIILLWGGSTESIWLPCSVNNWLN